MSYLDRESACALLGVKPASLYAYVSRGHVRARPHPDDPRSSQYERSDIERLAARKKIGRKREAIAKSAIGWGEPILTSQITNIDSGRLFYRGQEAITLSQTATLEAVAQILWGEGDWPLVATPSNMSPASDAKMAGFAYLSQQAAIGLPNAARPHQQTGHEAAALLEGLAFVMSNGQDAPLAHQKLARHWALNDEQGELIRQALVLLADHELNPSSFSARVTASTGACLAACALSGYATLTGPYHGEAAARALDFLTYAHEVGPESAIKAILERAQTLPGLDHPLYPDGDPRAGAFLKSLRPYPLLADTLAMAESTWGLHPNIDLVLGALSIQLRLPPNAPFTLFAVARMAGWLAHAREQARSGTLIRPRARYIGAFSG